MVAMVPPVVWRHPRMAHLDGCIGLGARPIVKDRELTIGPVYTGDAEGLSSTVPLEERPIAGKIEGSEEGGMTGPRLIDRQWTEDFVAGSVRLRCAYQRRGKQVLRFTVQLEAFRDGAWHAVVRYDNAHGFCHRDTLHADGSQEKAALFVGDINATFTYGVEDLKANWPAYYARYVKEVNP
jgi:hypothetical protein